jgi:hypothetical protein
MFFGPPNANIMSSWPTGYYFSIHHKHNIGHSQGQMWKKETTEVMTSALHQCWSLLQLIFQVTRNIQKVQNHCHHEINKVILAYPLFLKLSLQRLIVTIWAWAVLIRIIDSASITTTVCTTWGVNHHRPITLAGVAMT